MKMEHQNSDLAIFGMCVKVIRGFQEKFVQLCTPAEKFVAQQAVSLHFTN